MIDPYLYSLSMFKDFLIFEGKWKAFNRLVGGWGYFVNRVLRDGVSPSNYVDFGILLLRGIERVSNIVTILEKDALKLSIRWRKVLSYPAKRRRNIVKGLAKQLQRNIANSKFTERTEIYLANRIKHTSSPLIAIPAMIALAEEHPELQNSTFYKLYKMWR